LPDPPGPRTTTRFTGRDLGLARYLQSALFPTCPDCRDEGRRPTLLSASGTFNGIDTVEVEKSNQTTLHVFFLNDLPDVATALDQRPDLASGTGGERIRHIRVVDTVKRPDHRDVLVDQAGDFSTYTLSIRLPALDPIFSSAPFSFKAGCPSPFDCPTEPPCVKDPEAEPLIDYYVKDYAGFQRAQLFEAFVRLQLRRGLGAETSQEFAAVSVKANMLQSRGKIRGSRRARGTAPAAPVVTHRDLDLTVGVADEHLGLLVGDGGHPAHLLAGDADELSPELARYCREGGVAVLRSHDERA